MKTIDGRLVRCPSLIHHGIVGQHWGVRNGPPYPLTPSETKKAVNDIFQKMTNVEYSDFVRLKTPQETFASGKGSCHDQVMAELDELRKLGIKASARFLIEYNPENDAGGTTHSYVYIRDGKNVLWLENAWAGKKGVHPFRSVSDIEHYISESRKRGEWGDRVRFSKVEFADFKPEKHQYGEDLQTLIDICLE